VIRENGATEESGEQMEATEAHACMRRPEDSKLQQPHTTFKCQDQASEADARIATLTHLRCD